jgi:hypothetical protein
MRKRITAPLNNRNAYALHLSFATLLGARRGKEGKREMKTTHENTEIKVKVDGFTLFVFIVSINLFAISFGIAKLSEAIRTKQIICKVKTN